MKNPFEFGRELGSSELVDRESEISRVVGVLEESSRLFMIGPRRFGKTSILRAAAEEAEARGIVVFRHDAEAYPTLRLLAETIVAEAAERLTSTVERAGTKIRAFFGSLRPQVSYNPLDQSYSIGLTVEADSSGAETALLTGVLDGLDRMAADSGHRVGVIVDEFQQIIEREGLDAERQLRSAVQRHSHVGYVFAGSKTRLLTEMTSDPTRPFYRLGERLFVGAVPRQDFSGFLRQGFEHAGYTISDEAVDRILDRAEDVPYNVQRLAHECWDHLRDHGQNELDAAGVDRVLHHLVQRDDPFYTQMWNRLTSVQQKALLALIARDGRGLFSRDVLRRYGLALSSLRTALDALAKTGIAREEEERGSVRLRLEDPFFAAWVELFVARP